MTGFVSLRHNHIRDLTAGFLTQMCHYVQVEPLLQSLHGETFRLWSANHENQTRFNVAVDGFRNSTQQDCFDIRGLTPLTNLKKDATSEECLR